MFIRHGPLSGSTVSTIPATEAELDAVSQVTPPPKKDKKDKNMSAAMWEKKSSRVLVRAMLHPSDQYI